MTYSTGSGSFTALMAAVLAHAVTDGWTTSAGVWPISKGNVGWVDWSTFTTTEADMTLGGDGVTKTQRYLRLGMGTSAAAATLDAATSAVQCANFAYTMSEWHIFSDPSVNDHIHVVFRFSNGPNSDCYGHFSIGEIQKAGLTYGSVNYITASWRRGYAVNGALGGTGGEDWNNLPRGGNIFAGAVGAGDTNAAAHLSFMTRATSAPHPNGTGGWPAYDTVVRNGASVWGKTGRMGENVQGPNFVGGGQFSIDYMGWAATQQPFSGAVTLMPIAFMLINGTGFSNRMLWLGVFPNVRKCSMEGFNPGDEVTYGSETWKLFPLLRSTPNTNLGQAFTVTSGRAGFAYKKVA